MVQRYMKWMLVSRTSAKGFTILEMMVGIAMTLTVSALALAALSNAESGFSKDKNKIEGGQKLSSVLDIVGRDLVQAGEQVNEPKFPVVNVIPDGTKGSRLIVYRGIEEALSTCAAIAAGTATTTLSVASTDTAVRLANPACTSNTSAYSADTQDWITKRTATGNPTPNQLPFILHNGQGNIQRAVFTGESNSNSYQIVALTTSSFTPSVAFPVRSTAYLMEKREYLICNGNELKVRVNSANENDCTTADSAESPFQTIATKIKSLNITVTTATTASPTPADSLDTNFPTTTLNWRDLRGVSVKITASNPDPSGGGQDIFASGRYYPRNILSTNAE
jgi:Tfp pilus assembly protein PilW